LPKVSECLTEIPMEYHSVYLYIVQYSNLAAIDSGAGLVQTCQLVNCAIQVSACERFRNWTVSRKIGSTLQTGLTAVSVIFCERNLMECLECWLMAVGLEYLTSPPGLACME